MNANPTPLDFNEARRQFRQVTEERTKAREEYKREALLEADHSHDYYKNRAAAFAIYRAEGKGVQEADILARGDVAHHQKAQMRSHANAKAALLRCEQLEGDRANLRQMAEWSRQADPYGQPEEPHRTVHRPREAA